MNVFEKYAAKEAVKKGLMEVLKGLPGRAKETLRVARGTDVAKGTDEASRRAKTELDAALRMPKIQGSSRGKDQATRTYIDQTPIRHKGFKAQKEMRKARAQVGGAAAAAAVVPTALLIRALAKRSKSTPLPASARKRLVAMLKKHPKKSVAAAGGGLAGLAGLGLAANQ